MSNLLVLGSRPSASVPREIKYDIICANSSGYQAKTLGLEDPKFTIMSFGFAGGINGNALAAREKLKNLSTENLIYLKHRSSLMSKDWIKKCANYRYSPIYVKYILRKMNFRYGSFCKLSNKDQLSVPIELLGRDIDHKRKDFIQKSPSTGVYAVLWGIKMDYDRIIISGIGLDNESGYLFKTDGYYRGHIEIDTLVLERITERYPGRISTTESDLSKRANVPFFDECRV